MRVVCWNCRRATKRSPIWDHLLELRPDLALLQEVSSMPEAIESQFAQVARPARGKSGNPQRFQTVILARGQSTSITLEAPREWIGRELRYYDGNLVAADARLETGDELKVVSVYSPAWPLSRERLATDDKLGIQLTQSRDVWVTELIWAAMGQTQRPSENWIVGGDFNSCETFDSWKGGPRGNREFLDRMASLGLVECLRKAQGQLTPTFRKPSGRAVTGQLDHCFVSSGLERRLDACRTSSHEAVFGAGLSDHLPIIADFRDRDAAA